VGEFSVHGAVLVDFYTFTTDVLVSGTTPGDTGREENGGDGTARAEDVEMIPVPVVAEEDVGGMAGGRLLVEKNRVVGDDAVIASLENHGRGLGVGGGDALGEVERGGVLLGGGAHGDGLALV
jgi:hypothetical protein